MTDRLFDWEDIDKDAEDNTSFNGSPSGSDPDMSVDLGRIKLANPIITCSGTFSHGEEHQPFYDISILGAVTTKSYSLKSRKGNPPPRVCETPAGLLNSIGLQNEGIDAFIGSHLRQMNEAGAKIILSIFGRDAEEFKKVALKVLDVKSEILAVELNLSCPNIERGGISFCAIPEEVEKVVDGVVSMLDVPVIAKLSPNHDNIIQSAIMARKAGAEALSVVNTIVGMAVDIETARPLLGNITGGLSGPAIKPVALVKVYELAEEDILPIIGMGGIFDYRDVLEFMIVGASAISLGTVNLVDYDAGKKILADLKNYLAKKKIESIKSIIGRLEGT
ncbi:MAG: dihydroorotate dehydrogenase [Actinomycetia bacterium]|nr:dihydroorotate dehydrogenase [Actinomycetes bacterium]